MAKCALHQGLIGTMSSHQPCIDDHCQSLILGILGILGFLKSLGFRAPGLGLGVLHAEIASLGYLIQRFSEDFHRLGGTDPLTNKSPGLQTKCGVWDVVRL